MKSSTIFLLLAGCILGSIQVRGRDPFWPIDYRGGVQEVEQVEEPEPMPEVQVPKKGRELSDDELRDLARKESERIRQSLVRKGTMIAGDNIYAYVQNKWVTVGDVLTVQVEGNSYRLEILKLTSDNIELEAYRSVSPSKLNPGNQP